VVLFFNHEAALEEIIRWSDEAMYRAKDAGRNNISFRP
jgi:GGDEF domain-containing protein